MFHAREHYGVRPVGYNTTTEQVAELRAQIEEQGLQEEMQVYDECMQCR
jgi:hypothetical protein